MEKLSQFDVLKLGTDVLMTTDFEGDKVVDENLINAYGKIISRHKERIILVTSGAKGTGGGIVGDEEYLFGNSDDCEARDSILAGIGNPQLSGLWDSAIAKKILAQALITNKTDKSYAQRLLRTAYTYPDRLIVQVNGNDIESPKEKHRDNDQNALNIATWSMDIAEKVRLSMGTAASGFCEHFGVQGQEKKIDLLDLDDLTKEYLDKHCGKSTEGGTGDMRTKMDQIKKAVKAGVVCYVFNGKDPKSLDSILKGEDAGTKIITSRNISEV